MTMTTPNPNVVFTTKDPYCDHLASPNPYALGLSIFLVLGILGSYLPQHLKIIRHQTSAGLAPLWVLLGTLSSIFATANVIVLPTSQHDMACCSEISGSACAAALLGIVQVGVQWACFMGIMVLFLIFFPRPSLTASIPSLHSGTQLDIPNPRHAALVGFTSLITLLFVAVTSTAILVSSPASLLAWANTLGIGASIFSSVQYLPQLYTTWRLGQVYSLSVLTMMIQVPGSFLFAFSLWLRVGWQGWSTWAVYCVSGCLQGALLCMAIYFSTVEKKGDGFDEDGETAPLFSGDESGNGGHGGHGTMDARS